MVVNQGILLRRVHEIVYSRYLHQRGHFNEESLSGLAHLDHFAAYSRSNVSHSRLSCKVCRLWATKPDCIPPNQETIYSACGSSSETFIARSLAKLHYKHRFVLVCLIGHGRIRLLPTLLCVGRGIRKTTRHPRSYLF